MWSMSGGGATGTMSTRWLTPCIVNLSMWCCTRCTTNTERSSGLCDVPAIPSGLGMATSVSDT